MKYLIFSNFTEVGKSGFEGICEEPQFGEKTTNDAIKNLMLFIN